VSFPVPQEHLLLVSALGGDEEALHTLLLHPDGKTLARRHRLRQALSLRLPSGLSQEGQGEALRKDWRQALTASAGHHLLLEHHLKRIGTSLGEAGIPWMPFKGMDLASRVYDQAAERPMSDIDLLLHRSGGEEALPLLFELGWRDPFAHPRHERFLRDEGYCWTLVHEDGSALEVHFRLWGMVPGAWSDAVLERGLAALDLGSSARRPRLADAYLLAAVHAWMSPAPRPLLTWWDLERIHARVLSDDETIAFASEVQEEAQRWDLQLPVALAAGHAAALWPETSLGSSCHREIYSGLQATLRWPERRVLHKARSHGSDASTLTAITLARLLARRRGRTGLGGAWRRLWSHPGIVGRETPESWPWPARRLWRQLKTFGFPGLARQLARRLQGPPPNSPP